MFALTLPEPNLNYRALYAALLPLASVLLIAGFWPAVVSAPSSRELLLVILKFAVLVGLIAKFSVLGDLAQSYVDNLVVNTLKASPDEVASKYLKVLHEKKGAKDSKGFFSRLFSPATSFAEAMLACILLLFSLFAGCVQAVAYLFQKLAVQATYGLSPLFLALLSIGATRSVGTRFILGTVGILLWPLGWAVASLVTDALLKPLVEATTSLPEVIQFAQPVLFNLEIFTALIGLWIIFSTLVAPWIIQLAITTGSQTGTGFLSAGATTVKSSIHL